MAKQRSEGPQAPKPTEPLERGKAHRTSTERARLAENPNLNQAGNELGSNDQAQGSQTGNDVDTIPE
jgi:hypothetical protein